MKRWLNSNPNNYLPDAQHSVIKWEELNQTTTHYYQYQPFSLLISVIANPNEWHCHTNYPQEHLLTYCSNMETQVNYHHPLPCNETPRCVCLSVVLITLQARARPSNTWQLELQLCNKYSHMNIWSERRQRNMRATLGAKTNGEKWVIIETKQNETTLKGIILSSYL